MAKETKTNGAHDPTPPEEIKIVNTTPAPAPKPTPPGENKPK